MPPTVRATAQPGHAGRVATPLDGSLWVLAATNLVALILAVVLDWRLVDLMVVYWAQSIIIGASYYARIMGLEKFSTKNFRINNRAVEPTEKTKRQTAFFFLVHFGGFHVFYAFFIGVQHAGSLALDLGFFLCTAAFAANHWFSYRYHTQLDRQGTPNIGTLMFTPYLRIVPMHLIIVLGAATASGGVLLFGLMKTVADIGMHIVEHRSLQKQSTAT